jgi:hypothetical protein
MKFEAEALPLSELIDKRNELVVCDQNGVELRTIQGVVILGGETVREALEGEIRPGERVMLRRKPVSRAEHRL